MSTFWYQGQNFGFPMSKFRFQDQNLSPFWWFKSKLRFFFLWNESRAIAGVPSWRKRSWATADADWPKSASYREASAAGPSTERRAFTRACPPTSRGSSSSPLTTPVNPSPHCPDRYKTYRIKQIQCVQHNLKRKKKKLVEFTAHRWRRHPFALS